MLGRINIPALVKLMRKNIKCFTCPLPEKHDKGEKCPGCMYALNSNHDGKGGRIRVSCNVAFAEYLGITNGLTNSVGRVNLVYYFMHPELWYSMPPMPFVDFFGNPGDILLHWQMHHYVNMYNDICVVRSTNREHIPFEAMMRRGDPYLIRVLKISREIDPTMELGTVIPKNDMKEYYKLWKKNSSGFWILKSDDALREIYEATGKIKFYGDGIKVIKTLNDC
jgi:hypothetical protein